MATNKEIQNLIDGLNKLTQTFKGFQKIMDSKEYDVEKVSAPLMLSHPENPPETFKNLCCNALTPLNKFKKLKSDLLTMFDEKILQKPEDEMIEHFKILQEKMLEVRTDLRAKKKVISSNYQNRIDGASTNNYSYGRSYAVGVKMIPALGLGLLLIMGTAIVHAIDKLIVTLRVKSIESSIKNNSKNYSEEVKAIEKKNPRIQCQHSFFKCEKSYNELAYLKRAVKRLFPKESTFEENQDDFRAMCFSR